MFWQFMISVLTWWLRLVLGSYVAILMILVWDWFFYRRLPYARWRTSQLSPKEARLVRELVRVKRLEAKEDEVGKS